MADQIVEITQTGYHLAKHRGFLEVKVAGELVGKVPLDDLLAVIIAVPGASISTNLLDQLSQRHVPLVICGSNFLPTCLTLPVEGLGKQFGVMRAQVALSEPRRKQAWKLVVERKIGNQAEVLERVGQVQVAKRLVNLAKKVRSGDPENVEAQAARLYWQSLFGSEFRRDRQAVGLNGALNYAYTVTRACVARAVSAAGLHPSFSLHHKNPQNAWNLVDDLIEPFRPVADYLIWLNQENYAQELTSESKAKLVALTSLSIPIEGEISPLSLATVRLARSLASYCLSTRDRLQFPQLPSPLEMGRI